MTRYVIGVDAGSQSAKVTIFDERGVPVASGRRALRPLDTPAPGVAEHPDDDLWTSVAGATRDALRAFPGEVGDVVGMGLCTIRFCRALVRADGDLAAPVLSWMDDRLSRPHEPRGGDDVATVTTSSGYLTQRLTGRRRDSAANQAGAWPVDPVTGRWLDDEGVAAAGLRRDQLVELVEPGEVLGTVTAEAAAVTGLPVGLPVVATANDKAVEALGCGLGGSDDAEAASTVLVSLGTYVAGMTVGGPRHDAPTSFWVNRASEPGRFLYESVGVRRGMGTISWFRDLVGPAAAAPAAASGRSLEEVLGDEAAAVPAGSDGLLAVLDWLAPVEAPWRRGSLLGLHAGHGRGHVHRCLLEALATTMCDNVAAMARELSTPTRRVVLSGGGARSDLMAQLTADVFGLPVVRTAVTDAAGLGAALCAAVGVGLHGSFEAARRAMVADGDEFTPNLDRHALYRELAEVRRDAAAVTDALGRRTAERRR